MKLSQPMIEVFSQVVHGKNTLEKIALTLGKSLNWVSEIIKDLEKESLIVKNKSYKIKGSRIGIEVANTNHALKLKELIFQYSTIKFEDVLSDSKLFFLAALSEDWITLNEASKLSRVSRHTIARYKPELERRGIISKKKNLYKVNEKAWPLLKEFLFACKNYSTINGYVKWKYGDEILFGVDSKDLVQGSPTGLVRYKEHGVKVSVISILCKLPQAKLSKEDIFVHSLFQVNDSRTLHLALTFYLKNKLNYKKTLVLAMRYGKYTMFEDFIKILKTKENRLKLENLPEFDRKDFTRIANTYGVKNV